MKKIPKLSTLIADKKLDWFNPDIKDGLFKIPKEISSDYKLYHFNKYISSEDVIKEMATDGYRPANCWELLLWPDWNNKDLVVTLDSVCEVAGNRRVPYLDRSGSERHLSLHWWDDAWRSRYRFLAVRNSETGKLGTGDLDTLSLEARVTNIEKWIEKESNFINPFPEIT